MVKSKNVVEKIDRKKQILQAAIEIITSEGYAALGMRSLARASGLKLGALQYHFANWEALLEALVDYVGSTYWSAWESQIDKHEDVSLLEALQFVADDPPAGELHSEDLWPQLWAMGRVEPLVQELVDEIYARYLRIFERALKRAGSRTPRVEAIALMSMLEGSSLFVGSGRRWEKHSSAIRKLLYSFVTERYGDKARLRH